MAQHKQSLQKTMQSAFKHKKAGTEVSTAVLAVEALVLTSVAQESIVENADAKVVGRCRAALAHKSFGKRLADAISTMEAIIEADALAVEAEDKALSAQHKQGLRKILQGAMANKSLGTKVADMVSKAEKAIDLLIAKYPADADLVAIKEVLQS